MRVFPGGARGEESALPLQETKEMQFRSLDQEDPLEGGTQPIPVFLPRESHGQRSLADYSP